MYLSYLTKIAGRIRTSKIKATEFFKKSIANIHIHYTTERINIQIYQTANCWGLRFATFLICCFKPFFVASFVFSSVRSGMLLLSMRSHINQRRTLEQPNVLTFCPFQKTWILFFCARLLFFTAKLVRPFTNALDVLRQVILFFCLYCFIFFTARFHISPKTCLFWVWFYSYSLVRLERIVVIQTRKQLLKLFSFGWQNTRIKRKW